MFRSMIPRSARNGFCRKWLKNSPFGSSSRKYLSRKVTEAHPNWKSRARFKIGGAGLIFGGCYFLYCGYDPRISYSLPDFNLDRPSRSVNISDNGGPDSQLPLHDKVMIQGIPGMSYSYVIIGSGTAASTALESIRLSARSGETILLISDQNRMATLDVATGHHRLDERLQDLYNQWRRHLACKLGFEGYWRSAAIEPSDADSFVSKENGNTDVERRAEQKQSMLHSLGKNRKSSEGFSPDVSVTIDNLSAIEVNPEDKTITLSNGSVIGYNKCLLASSGKPREFYVLQSSISFLLKDKINTLRNVDDFADLERVVKKGGQRILVIGGGYLGSTLCSALVEMSKDLDGKPNEVFQTFVELMPLQQYFPDYLCRHIMDIQAKKGINFFPDRIVTAVSFNEESSVAEFSAANGLLPHGDDEEEKALENRLQVTLMQGNSRQFLEQIDIVVLASTNVAPDVGIAKNSDLEIDPSTNGIVCNQSLEVYDGLFAAGASASYYDAVLGRRRVDFYDHAINTGLLAGRNMSNEDGYIRRYLHQPSIRIAFSGIDMTFEAVGNVSKSHTTRGLWLRKRDPATGCPGEDTAYERGVVFYLKDDVVKGMLVCNASECLDLARDVIRERLSFEEASRRILLAPPKWIKSI